MSGDSDSLLALGGSELAQHYPDRGLLPSSNWHNATLSVEADAGGLWGWLKRLEVHSFGAVLSANGEGLRVAVLPEEFATFIPWPEATVSAERAWPVTVIRLKARAVPALTLVLHLDDAAADELLQGAVPPLPQRAPPRRPARLKPWAAAVVGLGLLAVGGSLASLWRSEVAWPVAVVVAVAGVCLALLVWKSFI
jgi:hypothetical protein